MGTNLADCYSLVSASSYEDGMKLINSATNMQYAFTYTGDESIARQIKSFHLHQVPLQPQVKIS